MLATTPQALAHLRLCGIVSVLSLLASCKNSPRAKPPVASSATPAWLVRLRGTRSNREGLGAEATVVLPNGRQILKPLDGKSGYLSQSDLPLYFGLGDADHADRIEVRWPSGRHQTMPGPINAGRTIEVVEQ